MNPLLEAPLKIVNGAAAPSDQPGVGLAWNAEMVRRYAQI
jgi:L-alanine-DL-glutamate epimerase-like enolase superfamily enzyme